MTRLENRLNSLTAELTAAQSTLYSLEHRRDYNPEWPLSEEDHAQLEALYTHVEDLSSTIARLKNKL